MARFDSAGAKLIAIGVGTPDKARILADGVSDLVARADFCTWCWEWWDGTST
jgi:hypothetical protein